ncbi:MAG: thioredoxin domain-containing protein, partial [Gammaproteobacteria bacterium]|nr:thioredoxin domain-containing protein [Gammaproteobacteria bacterium]
VSEAGLSNRFARSTGEVAALLASAKSKLRAARDARVAPGRDEKILTAWNALMIKGMARAGRCLQRKEFIASAERAVGFIRAVLWRDGRLLATYKDDQARLPAYLDDYAFLLDALLELLQARWRLEDLVFATRLADALLDHFADADNGGFFFTADDHETLIHRPKPLADEATPSGNGVAAQVLNRLGHLLGETRYLTAAENTVHAASGYLRQSGMAHASLTNAYEEMLAPPEIVIIRGDETTLQEWSTAIRRDYAPHRLTFCIPYDAEALPSALADKAPLGDTVAYVCTGPVCSQPLTDFDAFIERMHSAR